MPAVVSSRIPAPRVATPANALTHSLVRQLDEVQWWDREKIRSNQLLEIRKLLRHASGHSTYYQALLANTDIDRLSLAQFGRLPVLERATLQRERARINCSRTPREHGSLSEMMTSGSTGVPVVIQSTGLVAAVWAAVSLRDHLWHGRDARQRNAALRWRKENIGLAPEGRSFADWGPPHNQFFETGPGYYLNTSSDIEQQLDWLRRRDPHYLITHPSNLRALLLAMRRHAWRPASLRQVRTVGEALPAELRELVAEVLEIPLVDCYSSQEAGYIALQCPRHEHYHVQAENLYVEVLDEEGIPCRPGASGRVVITSLRNYATPLIRYAIGDYAEVGADCSCGRGLPVLARIEGRVRNMLRLPGGGLRWPNLGFSEIMRVAAPRQFQVVQEAPDRLRVRLVVDAPLAADQESAIIAILRRFLDFPYRITLSYHDAIPRSAGGKYEDFLSLLGDD
ncbi:MAG: hypothetical protein WD396_09280 [Pseudohongiellaceae bacterium]